MNNIEEMKRLADAATPGPWRRGTGLCIEHVRKSDTKIITVAEAYGSEWGGPRDDECDANYAYIAAANPAAVLELIKQRDELMAAIKSLYDAIDCCHDLTPDLLRKVGAVIAKAEG